MMDFTESFVLGGKGDVVATETSNSRETIEGLKYERDRALEREAAARARELAIAKRLTSIETKCARLEHLQAQYLATIRRNELHYGKLRERVKRTLKATRRGLATASSGLRRRRPRLESSGEEDPTERLARLTNTSLRERIAELEAENASLTASGGADAVALKEQLREAREIVREQDELLRASILSDAPSGGTPVSRLSDAAWREDALSQEREWAKQRRTELDRESENLVSEAAALDVAREKLRDERREFEAGRVGANALPHPSPLRHIPPATPQTRALLKRAGLEFGTTREDASHD